MFHWSIESQFSCHAAITVKICKKCNTYIYIYMHLRIFNKKDYMTQGFRNYYVYVFLPFQTIVSTFH